MILNLKLVEGDYNFIITYGKKLSEICYWESILTKELFKFAKTINNMSLELSILSNTDLETLVKMYVESGDYEFLFKTLKSIYILHILFNNPINANSENSKKIIATLKDVVNGSEFTSWLDKKKEVNNYQDTIMFVEKMISFFRLLGETGECTKLNSVLNSHIRKLDPNERLKGIIDL